MWIKIIPLKPPFLSLIFHNNYSFPDACLLYKYTKFTQFSEKENISIHADLLPDPFTRVNVIFSWEYEKGRR